MRGMRVKNIVRELSGEKIDIIRWDANVRPVCNQCAGPGQAAEPWSSMRLVTPSRLSSIPTSFPWRIGKKGQNARLTAKLTSWNIEIEKEETAELGFEEKVARAIQGIMTIQGIDKETAEGLVKGGFHSLEGLLAADFNDLTDILGAEKAAAAQQAANAEQERREAAQPPEGEPKA